MSTGVLALLALVAVLVFWAIGAYNRLTQMRSGLGQAWARIADALQRRATAVPPLLALMRTPLAAEQGALDAWTAAHAETTRCALVLSARPLGAASTRDWVAAEAALAAATSRVLALLDQVAALREDAQAIALVGQWVHGQARLPLARQLYNEAAAAYDEALAQYPTRLLVNLFGFKPAGRV